MKIKLFTFLVASICSFVGIAQPTGKAGEIIILINEARTNPQTFLTEYKTSINEYQPKLIPILETASPISKIIWDDGLAENCKQVVYGTLNPEYKGANKMCGTSSGRGSGLSSKEAIFFVCVLFTHIMDEGVIYFGFYSDAKGHSFSLGKSCEVETKYVFVFNGKIDSSMVDFEEINTAVDETELTTLDKEMIKEINFVRHYPKVYASIVAKFLSDESALWGLSKAQYDAGIEVIAELKVMAPAQIMFPKKCVSDATKKHAEDCQKRGYTDHIGIDGSSPFSRISEYCDGLSGNENMVGGEGSARSLVMKLLIDSGISSRGHRYNMLNPEWKYVGCAGYESDMWYYIHNYAMD